MWINEDCQRWQVSLVCLSLCLSVSFFLFCVCVSLCLGCRLLRSVSCFSFSLFLIRILSFLSFTINCILIFPEKQKNKHKLSFFFPLSVPLIFLLYCHHNSLFISLSLSLLLSITYTVCILIGIIPLIQPSTNFSIEFNTFQYMLQV